MTKWIGTMLYLISGLGLYPMQMQRLHQNHNYILYNYISSKRRTYTKTSSNLELCGSKSESPIPKLHRLSMVFPLRMVDPKFFQKCPPMKPSSITYEKKYHEIKSIYINLNKKDLSYWKKYMYPPHPPHTSYSLANWLSQITIPWWGQHPWDCHLQ